MIRAIIKWSRGLCTDLTFALHLRKTPENLSWETVWWKGSMTNHRLKWDPLLLMRSIGSHSTSEKDKERKKRRTGDELSPSPFDGNLCSSCRIFSRCPLQISSYPNFSGFSGGTDPIRWSKIPLLARIEPVQRVRLKQQDPYSSIQDNSQLRESKAWFSWYIKLLICYTF